jgi:voltage-gated potassium channel
MNSRRDTFAEILNTDQSEKTPFKRLVTKRKSRLGQSRSTKKTLELDRMATETNLDGVSGFDSVIMETKKLYYKKIKKKNREKLTKENHRKRIEALIRFILYIVSNIINVLSIMNYILETYFDSEPNSQEVVSILSIVEVVFSFYFIFEFFLLLWRAKIKIKYLFSLSSLIDMVTILPPIFNYFISDLGAKLSFVRVFRVLRVFRILRIYKSLKMIQYESSADNEEGESHNLKFDPIKLQFFSILVVLFTVFFVGSGVILFFQDIIPNAFSKPNMNFFDALYFMIVTYSSVGYGDISANHIVTRLAVIFGIFSLIVIISDQFSKLANLLRIWGPGLITYDGKDHLIIICDNSINLRAFLLTLKKSEFSEIEIVLITKEITDLPSREFPFNKVKLMNNPTFDLEVLDRANAKGARAIFIFSNKSLQQCSQKEKVTDFYILKINRYYKYVPIYVQTLYSERSFETKANKTGIGQKNTHFRKIIPILTLKSLIISKSLFNPGFAAMAQNLMFNDYPMPSDLGEHSSLIKQYYLGCENNIIVSPIPNFFVDMEFSEVVSLIYFKSIKEYLKTEIYDNESNSTRPVLLIGIVDERVFTMYSQDSIMIYPVNKHIKRNMKGIFISYNGKDYLKKVLSMFSESEGFTLKVKEEIKKAKLQNFGGFCSNSSSLSKEESSSFKSKSKEDCILDVKKDSKENVKLLLNLQNNINKITIQNPMHRRVKTHALLPNKMSTLEDDLSSNDTNLQPNNSRYSTLPFLNKIHSIIDTHQSKFSSNSKFTTDEKDTKEETLETNENQNDFPDFTRPKISNVSKFKYMQSEHLDTEKTQTIKKKLNKMVSFNKDVIINYPNKKVTDPVLKFRESPSSSSSDTDKQVEKLDLNHEEEKKKKEDSFNKKFVRRPKKAFSVKMNLQALTMNSLMEFGNEATNQNLQMLQEVEDKINSNIASTLKTQSFKRYASKSDLDLINEEHGTHLENFYENRMFDIEKVNMEPNISHHILIFGYEDNLTKLLKILFHHFPNREIAIVADDQADEKSIIKLLKQYKSLLYFKGNYHNAFNLLNMGINKAEYLIFLCEAIYQKTNEDMGKILSYKTVDYFFSSNKIIELWDSKSTRFLGYQPLESDGKINHNEFVHPSYMAGNVVYLSHFEKILARSFTEEKAVDAWIRLISLGYSSSNTNIGYKTLRVNRNSFPVIVTIDVPKSYKNKDYHDLFCDLLTLDPPALALGLLIENPLEYLSMQSKGYVGKTRRAQKTSLKITTSYKKNFINVGNLDKIEQGYKDNLKIMRDVSYNDRVTIDYVDINKSHLPIFITNPLPSLQLGSNCKVQVLYHYSSDFMDDKKKSVMSQRRSVFLRRRVVDVENSPLKMLRNSHSISPIESKAKAKIKESQNNLFMYFDILREKLKGSVSDALQFFEKITTATTDL